MHSHGGNSSAGGSDAQLAAYNMMAQHQYQAAATHHMIHNPTTTTAATTTTTNTTGHPLMLAWQGAGSVSIQPTAFKPQFLLQFIRFQPSLARHKGLLLFDRTKTRDVEMYPFQALLTCAEIKDSLMLHLQLLEETLTAYPEVLQERTEQEGWTPLHIAAKYCTSFEVFQFLLDRKPDFLSAKDKSNMNPMYYLVYRSLSEPREMQLLLERILKAYPMALGQGQNSLFTFAFYVGAPADIIQLLSHCCDNLLSLDICNQGPQASYKSLVGEAKPATADALLAATTAVTKVKRLIFAYRVIVAETDASVAFFRELTRAQCDNLEAFYFVPPSDCNAQVITAIADFVKSLRNLKKLWISGVGGWSHLPANETNSDELLNAIGAATAPTLEEVLIQKFKIRRSGLGCFLNGTNSIETMTVDQCILSQEAAEELGGALARTDNKLRKLTLEGVEETSNASLDAIVAGLGEAGTVRELKIEAKSQEGDTEPLNPRVWRTLKSLETASLFFSTTDNDVPRNESRAFCAVTRASRNLRKISSHYGNFDNAEFAQVIRHHRGLREIDIDMHDEAEITSEQEPDTMQFEGFHHIVEALKENRFITSIGQAHSKHWRDVTFYVVRNWLELHKVGQDENLTLNKFVDAMQNCADHVWDGEVDDPEEEDQNTLSLYYECLRNVPHLWSQPQQQVLPRNSNNTAKRRRLNSDGATIERR